MKQNKLGYAHGTILNIYIFYELKNKTINDDFTVLNGLFGAVERTKDVSTSHYVYNGYGLCLDSKGLYSINNAINGRNILIFGADMSFSSHPTNKTQDIYVLGRGETRGINGTTLRAEKMYKTNIAAPDKKNLY